MKNIERDMRGYGPKPPHPHWPQNARLAITFVLNYEEGGERNPLYGDATAETVGGEFVIEGAPKGFRFLWQESIFEYGSRAGFWRIIRLFEKYQMNMSINVTAHALQFNSDVADYLAKTSHEIINHGYRWIDLSALPIDEERKYLELSIRTIEHFTGKKPVGWCAARPSINTRKLLVENGSFLYDSDSFADDLPYYKIVEDKRHLILPFAVDTTDFRFVSPQGYSCGNDYYSYLKDTVDYLYEEGKKLPKMVAFPLHPRVVGRPGRAAALEKFLQYLLQFKDIWICRYEEIARHWLKTFP